MSTKLVAVKLNDDELKILKELLEYHRWLMTYPTKKERHEVKVTYSEVLRLALLVYYNDIARTKTYQLFKQMIEDAGGGEGITA